MKLRLFVLYSLFFISFLASAQVRVTGRITDLQQKPVGDVIVKLMIGNRTLAFTSTNAKGEYVLKLKEVPKNEVMLLFNHISYERESESLVLKEKETKMDKMLTPKTISLKEVMVKSNPLRQLGDTLTHRLASFLGKGDVTLEDGLKRLPGVDVAKNGAISYMGKPISQFNIEGLDLLGGKYNLATRNIPADYVTDVEIVRNHHSRKVEKDVPSNEVSMNIKLSKKAKFKPFGQEEIGASPPVPLQEERGVITPEAESQQQDYLRPSPVGEGEGVRLLLGLTGMMFTDQFQTICSLKGGNYKNFARADMFDHFGGNAINTPATSLFGGFDGGAPPQGEYLYQRNGMVTLNAIHKLDSVTTVKVNADYSYHRATHDISQSSTYLAGDGSYVTVNETTSPLSKTHLPKLSLNYQKNADNVYLSDEFFLKGMFEQNEGNIVANGLPIGQHRSSSSFEIDNSFYWADKTAKGTHRYFSSPISFKRTPALRLTFSPSYSPKGDGVMLQTAQSSTLTMNIHSSFTIPFGKTFRLQLPVALNAMYDDLETIFSPPSQKGAGEGSVNDIHGWALNPTLNPGFDIHSRNRRFYLSAGLGAALKGLYNNRMNYTKLVLNPSVGINYTFSANSKWSFSSGYSTQIGDMMTLLTEPMQVNYRTVRTSSGIIGESNTWHTSSDWKWQLPLQYFTLSIGASHSEDKRNTLNSQHIDGIDISSSALLRDTRSRTTSFTFASTKNFPSLLTKLGVDANYSFGDSEQAVNADIIKVRSNNYNVHGNSTISPITWLELRYDIRYGWSQSRYADSKNITTSLTHSGAIHVFPIAVLDLSFNYDHVRRQITSDQYKHMSLFNASAQYKFKRLVLRLELDNLLNQRHYAYTIFDGINTYTYDYTLCGRTVMLRATFKL